MDIETDIRKICMQTDYTEDVAKEKLGEMGGDVNKVIRGYLGLPIVPATTTTKKTMNQEIYRQFREKIHISDGITQAAPTSTSTSTQSHQHREQ